MDTSIRPDAVAESLAGNRSERVGFVETLVGFDTQTPSGGTVGYTTVEALVRNATAYAAVPYEYEQAVADLPG